MNLYRRVRWRTHGTFSPVQSGTVYELLGGWVQVAKHAPGYRGVSIEGMWRGVPWVNFRFIRGLGTSRLMRYTLTLRLRWFFIAMGKPYADRYKAVIVEGGAV